MRYFFYYKRAPRIKFATNYELFLDYYYNAVFNFKLFKYYILPWETMRKIDNFLLGN